MLQILLFWGGLAYFSFQDATTHSVPAQPFELWCVQIYLLSIPTHTLWWVAFDLVGRILTTRPLQLSRQRRCLADRVLASQFTFIPLLWVLLIACVTGLIHATCIETTSACLGSLISQ
jgi:hypothetical protein